MERKIISKELFCDVIEAMRLQDEHDRKCGDAFQLILPDTHVGNYDNHWLRNALIVLLQEVINDTFHKEIGRSDIEYFMFELDYGTKYRPGMITDKSGNEIDLSTSEKLYDYLTNNKTE